LRPGTDPYDPDNVLIFITGPLFRRHPDQRWSPVLR
jgi:aldehyde:ferredoxin oxidoreductase